MIKDVAIMDISKHLILIGGQDKTAEISSLSWSADHTIAYITFQNSSKRYNYSSTKISAYSDPRLIDLNESCAYVNTLPIYEPQAIWDFGDYIRIIDYAGKDRLVASSAFRVVRNGAANKAAEEIIAYLREIARHTAGIPGEEAFLEREMARLQFIHPDSVLSKYLNQQPIDERPLDEMKLIFPFRFNLSQKAALEKALTHSISVIDGPPGTGKTQTILNILANLVAMQGKSVAVVSNNNEAVKNVWEKLDKDGYGFLTARLGKRENQEAFFSNLPIAQTEGWADKGEIEALYQQILALNDQLTQLLEADRQKARLQQELRVWQLEQEHFETYYNAQDRIEIEKLPLLKASPQRIMEFLAETTIAKELERDQKILHKLKLLIKYRIWPNKELQKQEAAVLLGLQRLFYDKQIEQIKQQIAALEQKLQDAHFDELLATHQQYSEAMFRVSLHQSYQSIPAPNFTKKDFKKRFDVFIKTYPIILSTTHSLRMSIPNNYLLDYVVIDEASQVDLITGMLALSCCRNVIIVGDVKQLPQITNAKIQPLLHTFTPPPQYDYFEHNILTSLLALYGEKLPREILREHYRCHPRIIEFCNQKYYGGQLIPYKQSGQYESPLMLYKTAPGNHMRRINEEAEKGIYNLRELETIMQEVLDRPITEEEIGIVTPYRKQADKASEMAAKGIESDTVHKYQGREKSIMIMSTVLSDTADGRKNLTFVDDPQMLNVAVSRAIDQFILVTDYDLFFKKTHHIGDLIRYIQYNTLEGSIKESQVISIFDLLYEHYSAALAHLKAKMRPNARYASEEVLRVLLEEILQEEQFERLSYAQNVLLRNLLSDMHLLSEEQAAFVNNHASLDFVVFFKQDKACALVIEVDGVAFHENASNQLYRDRLKDAILNKYQIPFLRLPTNGSGEEARIRRALSDILQADARD